MRDGDDRYRASWASSRSSPGDVAAARRHFEESIALCRRIGARLFLALAIAWGSRR